MPFSQLLISFVDAIARKTDETVFALPDNQVQIAFVYDCVSGQEIDPGEQMGM